MFRISHCVDSYWISFDHLLRNGEVYFYFSINETRSQGLQYWFYLFLHPFLSFHFYETLLTVNIFNSLEVWTIVTLQKFLMRHDGHNIVPII